MERSKRKIPSLRFPALILLLICFSLVLFISYAVHLRDFTELTTVRSVTEGASRKHIETSNPTVETSKPPSSSSSLPTSQSNEVKRFLSPFEKLWDLNARQKGETAWLDSSKETPLPLAYDPNPTQDPRGAPLSRNKKVATLLPEITTKDRRATRIAPMIPLIPNHDSLFPQAEFGNEVQEWTIVIGIPSIDTKKGQRRRKYQRDSFFRYSNVFGGKNPTILIKYLLAYHPANNYTISEELKEEAKIHKDILFFDMREGVWKEKKKSWAVEVGMSRKAYAWYCFAADRLKFSFLMKGDDDEYIRTHALEHTLTTLPSTARIYYGRIMKWGIAKGSKTSFPFSGGMSITMSYDLIDWIRDSKIAEAGVHYYHEDVMVGRWFYEANIPLYVVRDCRHHDIHSGANVQKQTDASICIHHLTVCVVFLC